MFGYLTYGAVLSYYYRKRVNKYLHIPALTFLIPVYTGSLIQLFCYGLALIWPSVAVGLTFLYISLQGQEAFVDPLTSLYNRNYLLHYMEQQRKGVTLTGILLDINDFKEVNDSCGHTVGDDVLQAVGRMLLRCSGDNAVVVRYGGDEFVVLLKDGTADQVPEILAALRQELSFYNAASVLPLPLSLALGTAVFDPGNAETFFRKMDRDMYRDKRRFHQFRDEDLFHAAEDA